MRSIGQKWAYSITKIPGDQRHTVDHKQVRTKWFHACSGSNACYELTHVLLGHNRLCVA